SFAWNVFRMVSICSRVMISRLACGRPSRKGHLGTPQQPRLSPQQPRLFPTTPVEPNNPDCSQPPPLFSLMKPSDSATQPLQPPQALETRQEGGDRIATEPPPPFGRPPAPKNAGSVRPPRPDEIVVLRDIKKTFADQEVLRGIDLVAQRRETT